jgi:hypothetical protein
MMGFWVNMHPTFANAHVFRAEICDNIQENNNDNDDILENLKLDRNYAEPEIYLERRKLTAPFHSTDGTTSSIETEAFVTFVNADDLNRAVTLITMISSFKTPASTTAPMFIPIELKYQNPKQNEFLNNHRNIAIVGIVREAMDYKAAGEIDLYSSIKKLPGVIRCDPTQRPQDLGKWNISCNGEHHPDIARWIDDHLVSIWQTIPIDMPFIDSFPSPERLSKGRRARGSALSGASGLTDASPVAAYMKTLERNFDVEISVPKITRKSVPIEDVIYSFEPTTFPPMPKNKTTDTHTTASITASQLSNPDPAGATAISAITEGILSSAISGMEKKRATESAEFDKQLRALEHRVAKISQTVQTMSAEMTDDVMCRLSAHDGPLAKQDRVLAAQTEQMARMFQMLSALTSNVDTVTAKVARPSSNTDTDLDLSSPPDHADPRSSGGDACASPDRKKLKEYAHPDDEQGRQTE